jgi:hypothetical protein
MTVTDGIKDKNVPAGPKAMSQLEADAQALREKAARLRALRLAQETVNQTGVGTAGRRTALKKSLGKSGSKSGSKSGAKSVPLSNWLTTQQNEGRRN